MARRTRNESAQKQAIRKMMNSYLHDNEISIKDGGDVQRCHARHDVRTSRRSSR